MAEGRASRTMSRRLGLSVVAEIAGSTWTQRSTGLLASQTRRYFRGPRYRCDHNFTVAGVDCPLSVWMSRNVTTYDFLAPGIAGNLFEAAERIEQSQYHRCGVHLHGPSIKAASGKVKYDAQDSHALSHSASRISYRQVKVLIEDEPYTGLVLQQEMTAELTVNRSPPLVRLCCAPPSAEKTCVNVSSGQCPSCAKNSKLISQNISWTAVVQVFLSHLPLPLLSSHALHGLTRPPPSSSAGAAEGLAQAHLLPPRAAHPEASGNASPTPPSSCRPNQRHANSSFQRIVQKDCEFLCLLARCVCVRHARV
eukprot:3292377-Rhodomonas_salina.2